ncbi:MAG TPA: hypothetical protein VEK79_14105 [Thermoanaerobaculia bacterium]|nr:hypothetical protein [Thermoanaerobaculia bacterium]
MNPNRKPIRPALSAAFIALSTAYAVVVATGVLTITLCLTAWMNDTSFVEYYQYVFPRFRGRTAGVHIPAFGYVAFVMYVSVAASVAVQARKSIEGAWAKRHHTR